MNNKFSSKHGKKRKQMKTFEYIGGRIESFKLYKLYTPKKKIV